MSDAALNWIIQQLQQQLSNPDTQAIWCTDENVLGGLPELMPKSGLKVITNRWDIAQEATQKNFIVHFNDFDLSTIADNSLDYFFYRISKEKPVVHHLLNEAWRCLKPHGKLCIAGHKNEGIKTYIDKTAALFGTHKQIIKETTAYFSGIEKCNAYNSSQRLDDSDYRQLRIIAQEPCRIDSKPGLFGWNKIDQGSQYLVDQLSNLLNARAGKPHNKPLNTLDLGCGYGYLTLAAAQLDACKTITHWTMTDNNAAAVATAEHNIKLNGINAEVIAADCGDLLSGTFDLIVCNPPFHQGFSLEGDLTNRFLATTKRLLAPQGIAVFVVNQFIPLERKASGLFRHINTCASNGSFKVISLEI